MKNITRITASVLSLSLMGCASNGIPPASTESNVMTENVEKIFVGVPGFLALEGSTARLDSDWIVTGKHNSIILTATINEVYYHPICDIALIRESSNEINNVQVAAVEVNEDINLVGYPIMYPTISVSPGKHIGFVYIQDEIECDAYEMSTAISMGGMSGGGVYNTQQELIGVIAGTIWEEMHINGGDFDNQNIKDTSYFVNLFKVRGWLKEITGNDYFQE